MRSTEWIAKAIVVVDSIGVLRLSMRVVKMQRAGQAINKEKGWCAVRTLHITQSVDIGTGWVCEADGK